MNPLVKLVSIAMLFLDVARAELPDQAVQELVATQSSGLNVEIDGRLTEQFWDQSTRSNSFVQRDPEEGSVPSESTVVYVAYDSLAIYIAVECQQKSQQIIANERTRDAQLWDDDFVAVFFDTHQDRRNAYVFMVNPSGARWDALIRDDGLNLSDDWDGIWECGTAVSDSGWVAEIRIPLHTIRFPAKTTSWGFNVARQTRRSSELVQWQLIPRDRGGNGLFKVSCFGVLSGLHLRPPTIRWEFRPYVLGGYEKADVDEDGDLSSDWISHGGFDLRYKPAPDLAVDFTFNTDFAQVEADQQRISLSRFPLFYPEKRSFFLENADLFRVGEHHFPWQAPQTELFFSRTIGLSEDGDEEIPIITGARITGRKGKFDLGALVVATEETKLSSDEEEVVPSSWYLVARLQPDFLDRSKLGALYLGRESGNGFNRVAALDYSLSLGRHVTSSAFAALSSDSDEGEAGALAMHWNWSSDSFNTTTILSAIGEHFVDDMGFVMRSGVYKGRWSVSYDHRPRKWHIRDHSMFANGTIITDMQGHLVTGGYFVGTWAQGESGANYFFGGGYTRDELDEEFDLGDGDIVFDEDVYDWYSVEASYSSDQSMWLSGSVSGEAGGFYDAQHWRGGASLQLKPSPAFRTSLSYSHNSISRRSDRYLSDLISSRLLYTISTRISARSLLQWNNQSDLLGTQLVLRCTYRPGSDIYLVWDEQWPTSGSDEERETQLLVKITYWFPV